MVGTRKAPLWRQAFLRGLKRLGNVRAAAFEAGVDPGTAYDHRAKDAGFRAKWAGALKAYKTSPSPQPSPLKRGGSQEEFVLRRSKHGDKLVRAAPGRWSRRVEESFLDGLEHTGSVRAAAAAAGISANALYRRRDRYPEFAARWDERNTRAGIELPGLLNVAALECLSPQPEGAKRRGRARLPAIDVDQAIRIKVANDNAAAKAKGPKRRGGVSSQEQDKRDRKALEDGLVKLLGMMKKRRAAERLAAGWTELGNSVWVPPGWTVIPPSQEASADKPAPPEGSPPPAGPGSEPPPATP